MLFLVVVSNDLASWVTVNALASHSAQLSLSAILELLATVSSSLAAFQVSARNGKVLVVRYSMSIVEWKQLKVKGVQLQF